MCTAIKIDYYEGSVMGRTMDFEVPLSYNACFVPRNYNYCDDLMGESLYTKYKTLGMCFENRIPLKDGVNEHGLIGITNAFSGFNLYDNKVKEGKKNISSLNFLTYALSNYKSVDELIDDIEDIHISTKDKDGEDVTSPHFHYMFTDSSKRCVVIEPKKKKIVYHGNPYNVMTNSPHFESHITKLKKHLDLDNLESFNSSKGLPGGYDPVSRFIKAFYLNKMNEKSSTSDQALSHFYNIMSAMVMPKGFVKNTKYDELTYTRYTCCYDTRSRLLTVKTRSNQTVYMVGFEDIVNEDERQAFFLERNFVMEKLK